MYDRLRMGYETFISFGLVWVVLRMLPRSLGPAKSGMLKVECFVSALDLKLVLVTRLGKASDILDHP